MRFPNRLMAGLACLPLVGLVSCSGSAPAPAPHLGSAASSASSSQTAPTAASTAPTAASSAVAPATTGPPAVRSGPAEPETKAGARAAAANFYRLYSASQFAASWGLLSPAAQRDIPRAIWISVHNGCPGAGTGATRVIKSVLVFGNAAIVTESIQVADSRLGEAEDVFNYENGRWGYTPNNLGIYHHGSVAADIVSARAVGFCTGRNAAPM